MIDIKKKYGKNAILKGMNLREGATGQKTATARSEGIGHDAEKSKDYSDIINLPHPVSKKHPQMSLYDRAAQFSPFSALTGHEAAIAETGRLTEERTELDEDAKERLDEKLQNLLFRLQGVWI